MAFHSAIFSESAVKAKAWAPVCVGYVILFPTFVKLQMAEFLLVLSYNVYINLY